MKTFLSSLTLILTFTLTFTFLLPACADNSKVITFDLLPAPAQTLIQQYASTQEVVLVTQEGRSFWADYDVLLSDQSKWDFDDKGNLESVRIITGVPDGLVPNPIRAVVTKMYPDAVIVKYSIDSEDREQDVELNNRIEITFDMQGNVREIDVD